MDKYRLEDVVDIARVSNCAICNTFVYTLPCIIDVDFGDYLFGIGKLTYPLSKVKIVKLENEFLSLTSRVGRTWMEVKFKKQPESMKPNFDICIASYVENKQNIIIEV